MSAVIGDFLTIQKNIDDTNAKNKRIRATIRKRQEELNNMDAGEHFRRHVQTLEKDAAERDKTDTSAPSTDDNTWRDLGTRSEPRTTIFGTIGTLFTNAVPPSPGTTNSASTRSAPNSSASTSSVPVANAEGAEIEST
eukprot:764741_1